MAGGAQAALNMRPHSFLQHVAKAGEAGDDQIGHLSTGDTVIPVEKTKGNPRAQQMLGQVFRELGLDPKRFVVGHRENHTNKRTGLRQFEGTGAEGTGEGPGAEGGVGGNGPGGGGTGGPGNGASAGDNANSGVAGPGVSDPSTSSTTPGVVGTQNQSSLTGKESETAVESGTIPGTPAAQAAMNSGLTAAEMGVLGQFGQPTTDISALDSVLNAVTPKDPLAAVANLGFGMIPGVGIAGLVNSLSGVLGGPTVGSVAASLGRDAAAAIGGTGTTTGSGGTVGSGGGAEMPVDQAAQDAEWLKRLNLGA